MTPRLTSSTANSEQVLSHADSMLSSRSQPQGSSNITPTQIQAAQLGQDFVNTNKQYLSTSCQQSIVQLTEGGKTNEVMSRLTNPFTYRAYSATHAVVAAARTGQTELVMKLLNHVRENRFNLANNALIQAASHDQTEVIQAIIEHPYIIIGINAYEAAFEEAVTQGFFNSVKALYKHQAKLNTHPQFDSDAVNLKGFRLAIQQGHSELMKLFLNNLKDNKMNEPLLSLIELAAKNEQFNALETFFSHPFQWSVETQQNLKQLANKEVYLQAYLNIKMTATMQEAQTIVHSLKKNLSNELIVQVLEAGIHPQQLYPLMPKAEVKNALTTLVETITLELPEKTNKTLAENNHNH